MNSSASQLVLSLTHLLGDPSSSQDPRRWHRDFPSWTSTAWRCWKGSSKNSLRGLRLPQMKYHWRKRCCRFAHDHRVVPVQELESKAAEPESLQAPVTSPVPLSAVEAAPQSTTPKNTEFIGSSPLLWGQGENWVKCVEHLASDTSSVKSYN